MYKEIRRISAYTMRRLCISQNWYTLSTKDDYDELLYRMCEYCSNLRTVDIIEMAKVIKEHSATKMSVESIATEVANIATVYIVKVD